VRILTIIDSWTYTPPANAATLKTRLQPLFSPLGHHLTFAPRLLHILLTLFATDILLPAPVVCLGRDKTLVPAGTVMACVRTMVNVRSRRRSESSERELDVVTTNQSRFTRCHTLVAFGGVERNFVARDTSLNRLFDARRAHCAVTHTGRRPDATGVSTPSIPQLYQTTVSVNYRYQAQHSGLRDR